MSIQHQTLESEFFADRAAHTAFLLMMQKSVKPVIELPKVSSLTAQTLASKLCLLGSTGAVAFYSAYFSWGSSRDFAELLKQQTGYHADAFFSALGEWFALSGIGINGLQAWDIILEEWDSMTATHAPEMYVLLQQKTWRQWIQHNPMIIVGILFSLFYAMPVGSITYRDNNLLVGVLVAIFNLPVAYRGIMNFFSRWWFDLPCRDPRIAVLRQTKKLIAERILISFTDLLQLPLTEIDSRIDAFCCLTQTPDRLAFLLNASGEAAPLYLAKHPLSIGRRFFVALAIVMIVPFQVGYVLEAFIAGNHFSETVGILFLVIAAMVYLGLSLDATEELARESWDGRNTVSHVLFPYLYSFMQIVIFVVGFFSGATLALTNYDDGQDLLDASEDAAICLESGGFLSDAIPNIFYAIALIALWMRQWSASRSSDASRRRLALFERFIQEVATLFKEMPTSVFDRLCESNVCLPKSQIRKVCQDNGMQAQAISSLFAPLSEQVSQHDDSPTAPLLSANQEVGGGRWNNPVFSTGSINYSGAHS